MEGIKAHGRVQVAYYVAASRLIRLRYLTLFWTPCATHCIDLILKDMGKIALIKGIIDSARSITKSYI